MADSLLDLESLRSESHLPLAAPCFPLEQLLESLRPLRLSRRRLLQLGAASAAASLKAPSPHGEVSLRWDGNVLKVLFDGVSRWTIDPTRFSGSPRLDAKIGPTRSTFQLRGALFPGTGLPADFSGCISTPYGRWVLYLAFELGGFRAQLPLLDWLLRDIPAIAAMKIAQAVVPLGAQGRHLRLGGKATASFSPDWVFRLQGQSVAAISGFGRHISSNAATLGLPAQGDRSLFRSPQPRRSVVSLDGRDRTWEFDIEPPSDGRWSLSAPPGTFDLVQVELAENALGGNDAAVVARSTREGQSVSFCTGEELQALDGTTLRLPLVKTRYATVFSGSERETALVGDWGHGPIWAKLDGVALELGASPNTPPFEMLSRDGALVHLNAAPTLLRVAAPLGDSTISAGPIPICGTPEIRLHYEGLPGILHRLKCWLHLCGQSELCVPMHGSRLSVLRPDDLLRLDFEFVHLALRSHHCEPRLVRTDLQDLPASDDADLFTLPEALIIVSFPPQNIFEEASFEGETCSNSCEPDQATPQKSPPVKARISGPSRLVFRVTGRHIPYTLESLLDFARFDMKLVATALPPGETANGLEPVEPTAHDTALELPYRLLLSPNRFAGWANRTALPAPSDNTWIELWHTRLAIRNRAGLDERETTRRTLRAIWAVDYTARPCLPAKQPSDTNQPFRGSLSPRDRVELVELTANFSLNDPRDLSGKLSYRPAPVAAEFLALSAMGAWLKSKGQWIPPVTRRGQALTVELWTHVATMGRDHYVRVEYKGYLLPFGYPCTLVKVTERKFASIDGIPGNVAALRQRLFIVVKPQEKTYKCLGQQNGGRKWPFGLVKFDKTFTTPSLDEPCDSAAFWPQTDHHDVVFRYKLVDLDNVAHDCASPLYFIDATVAYDGCVSGDLALQGGVKCDGISGDRCGVFKPTNRSLLEQKIDIYNSAVLARRQISLGGRKVAYAPSRKSGDTQFETESITFAAEGRADAFKCAELFAADQAPVYPAMAQAAVQVASISELTGQKSPTDIEYEPIYLASGFAADANPGEVFVRFPGSPVPLTFGGASPNADKAGGLVTPNAGVVGLSRRIGPVGGGSHDSLSVTAKATFDPSDFFAAALSEAKILGGLKLADIIKPFASQVADTLEQAPRLLRRALASADATLKREATAFHQAVSGIRDSLNQAISSVQVIQERFGPQIVGISGDLADLDTELKKPVTDDPFATAAHDEQLIEIQARIVNKFKVLAAQVGETLRNPKVLLEAEINLLLANAQQLLTQVFANQLARLQARIAAGTAQAIDKLTDLIVTQAEAGIAGIAHLSVLTNALDAAQHGLTAAIAALPSAATVVNSVAAVSQVIDRFNAVRGQVRRVTDLAYVSVNDINAFANGARAIAGLHSTDFQADRTALETLFDASSASGAVPVRQGKRDVLANLDLIENKLIAGKQRVLDAGDFVKAQAGLVRSIDTFLGLPAIQLDPRFAQLLVPWAAKFTCLASATANSLQGVVSLLSLAGAVSAELVRVRDRANRLIADVGEAANAIGNPVALADLPRIATLLDRFGAATGFLEEVVDVLPLPAGRKDQLKAAGTSLDSVVRTSLAAINDVQAIYDGMRVLADAAPVILKKVVQQEIADLSAPLADYVATVEESALAIIAKLIANATRFVVDLLGRLEIPAANLEDLLQLSQQIEQVVADLLAPRAIELSYTWSPPLQDSPGGVFELEEGGGTNRLLVTARAVTYVSFNGPAKPPEFMIKGRLERFKLNLLGSDLTFITIHFHFLEFTSATGAQPHCDVKIENVTFGQALTFVQRLQNLLNPSDGPYLQITPMQIVAGFRYALPAVRTGGFSLRNLRFDASLLLPFTGDPARFRFKISERDNPFLLSVGILGGGGWFSLIVGLDGVDETELGLEFGLAGDISIGIATGNGRVMGGIYINYKRSVGTELTGFLDIAGHVDVIGLISLSLSVYIGIHRLSTGDCYGEATITVKIEYFFFDVEVRLHTTKQFAGDNGSNGAPAPGGGGLFLLAALDPQLPRSRNTDVSETEERELDWEEFVEAFA
jgi:hypothetical protein